jgi:hypothetical protein
MAKIKEPVLGFNGCHEEPGKSFEPAPLPAWDSRIPGISGREGQPSGDLGFLPPEPSRF